MFLKFELHFVTRRSLSRCIARFACTQRVLICAHLDTCTRHACHLGRHESNRNMLDGSYRPPSLVLVYCLNLARRTRAQLHPCIVLLDVQLLAYCCINYSYTSINRRGLPQGDDVRRSLRVGHTHTIATRMCSQYNNYYTVE